MSLQVLSLDNELTIGRENLSFEESIDIGEIANVTIQT